MIFFVGRVVGKGNGVFLLFFAHKTYYTFDILSILIQVVHCIHKQASVLDALKVK